MVDKECILCIKNEMGQNIIISWQRNQPNTLPTAVALDYGQLKLVPREEMCFLRGWKVCKTMCLNKGSKLVLGDYFGFQVWNVSTYTLLFESEMFAEKSYKLHWCVELPIVVACLEKTLCIWNTQRLCRFCRFSFH